MSHANAALTPRARLRLARLIVDHGWSPARAAERYDVSWRTAAKWAGRYRAEGEAGMHDRSSRPHRQPNRTPAPVVRKILHLRRKRRWGPVPIADEIGLAASTVHAVLLRQRANRLSHLDRATGEPIRRYEHAQPGDLLHVDVKKLGNVPDGGGWRYLGRQQGKKNRATTIGKPRNKHYNPMIGTAFVHTVIDDHSRVAYAEIHDDETAVTATAVLRRATTWFAERGVTTRRVLSDNGSAYKSHLWRDTCAELGITVKKTRPYRPQTNGKIERFHRTLADGWAFAKLYTSEKARRAALPAFLHDYNHHRPHTAIGKLAPITRLNNLAGHHN
ncbi:putative transposase [Actinoplanes missouriensis 431]|uniref:Putative transposase n=1 Tax=Actinoplanes missouriensis (strain ATCC 14538 / DSM 43046 / CBS 188.64 / JCM 3121 / NBRC 102363 / NCIMB 12654 / NRRL B-3342 / UNCC 431) TaxID=512565 RepID=I0H527_ACTM4|nr:IS481 family transposase [Actinoplanes missouriensis]BAL88114.1 putative transposase [Actinoplanes missouriensis 431]